MAKISAIQKNKKRERMVQKNQNKRKKLKEVIYDKEISLEERFEAVMKLAKLPRNGAKNRIKNRCFLTGRPRGYYRKFGLSRIALRDLAGKGEIPGLIKSSW